MKPCEGCGAAPPRIESGPFAGSTQMHDYCQHCSRDLCPKCMADGHCPDAPGHKHEPDEDF